MSVRLGLKFYFSSAVNPEPQKIVFVAGDDEYPATRKKGKKPDPALLEFEWSAGTQGFVLAILDYKFTGNEGRGFYNFVGSRTNSPAASACSAIQKQDWLRSGFGPEEDSDREIAPQVFRVRKRVSRGLVAFQVDSDRLAPQDIEIFLRETAIAGEEARVLAGKIEWSPHRSKSTNRLAAVHLTPAAEVPERTVNSFVFKTSRNLPARPPASIHRLW